MRRRDDDRIGREDVGVLELLAITGDPARDLGLRAGKALGEFAGRLRSQRRLVHVGRQERVGLDAGLLQQGQPARRSGRRMSFGRQPG